MLSSPGTFVLLEDLPFFWDAWDIMPYALEKPLMLSPPDATIRVAVIEQHPLRAVISVSIDRIGKASSLQQNIILCAGTAVLDFDTTVRAAAHMRRSAAVRCCTLICSCSRCNGTRHTCA